MSEVLEDRLNIPGDGQFLSYQYLSGSAPCVVFLHGLGSDMSGTKAENLFVYAKLHGYAYLRFDFRGHGLSGGNFSDYGIADWVADTVRLLDHLQLKSVVLVGSSMGGWVMLQVALARRQLVRGLLGIAAAPDFTLLMQSSLSAKQKVALSQGQVLTLDDGLVFSPQLLAHSQNQCLLTEKIDIRVPVRLLHGAEDQDVPVSVSLQLLQQLQSTDVRLQVVKGSGHRFSSEQDLELLRTVLADLLVLI